ncbi:type IX secretion system membrane protein PorP/SprF [Maribacter cobaltidurans]|uniref:type IX secretion system membrane protein PorP/SprF n=1 Tax=Maribacter cobaltidurans TaxID=1178778 RepID=UPI001E39F171|nr:type IX secretion system membrane protein PorP/SprF [Maribacter cobaltidurans]
MTLATEVRPYRDGYSLIIKININRKYNAKTNETYHKLLIAVALFALSLSASAQQDPNYTFYRYNMNIYNPAFAGSSDAAEFYLRIRRQWAGIEGAPYSMTGPSSNARHGWPSMSPTISTSTITPVYISGKGK